MVGVCLETLLDTREVNAVEPIALNRLDGSPVRPEHGGHSLPVDAIGHDQRCAAIDEQRCQHRFDGTGSRAGQQHGLEIGRVTSVHPLESALDFEGQRGEFGLAMTHILER